MVRERLACCAFVVLFNGCASLKGCLPVQRRSSSSIEGTLTGGGNRLRHWPIEIQQTRPQPTYTHEVVTVWYRPPEILLGSQKYSLPVDLWSIGCVIAEMATGSALFPGDSEIATIFKIFQRLGTPTEQMWPDITKLPYFKPSFPQWPAHSWSQIRNTLQQVGSDGCDLLDKLTYYDPRRRISAHRALQHAYFRDIDPRDGEV
eukprot:symbB.v1.2.024101.t1/scaffold2258.1/size84211/4